MLVEYNFKKDYAVKCINANKHNHVTTSYYLLLKRYEQLGEVQEKDFEYFDEKKIAALANTERTKQIQSVAFNQTMPMKKDDLSSLIKEDPLEAEGYLAHNFRDPSPLLTLQVKEEFKP
jgi:hypothetical protein